MSPSIPETMKAVVIDKFGGPEVLRVASLPVPQPGPGEVLIRVRTAGIGQWDPWLREGGSSVKEFPQVLGSDGAGIVAAVGKGVRRFKPGDRVYGFAYDLPMGFFAEYASIPEGNAAKVPDDLPTDQAGALAVSGLTALAAIDAVKPRKGRTLMITGASGGVGHVALQLAGIMGARRAAVASERDGVNLDRRLGADESVDGKSDDFLDALEGFAPDGFDAALVFVNSDALAPAMKRVKTGGTIGYPMGVDPEPKGARGVKVEAVNGMPSRRGYDRLNELVARGPFRVAITKTYPLEEAVRAFEDIEKHHVGKLAFKIRSRD